MRRYDNSVMQLMGKYNITMVLIGEILLCKLKYASIDRTNGVSTIT